MPDPFVLIHAITIALTPLLWQLFHIIALWP